MKNNRCDIDELHPFYTEIGSYLDMPENHAGARSPTSFSITRIRKRTNARE